MENGMIDTDVNKVIEEFGHLPLEDMEYVAEIIRKQLIEVKREALAARVKEAKRNYTKGYTKRGTLKDLKEDLEGD
jgi:hypothetical protein